jgi:hypothetical protein
MIRHLNPVRISMRNWSKAAITRKFDSRAGPFFDARKAILPAAEYRSGPCRFRL